MELTRLSERFETFAKKECAGSSELYEYLSLKMAGDEELLELSSYAKDGQPVPNLFLGAVHYLLLTGTEHKLRNYYPSIVEKPKSPKEAFLPFRDFCSSHRDQIIPILKEKIVQTNEVRRCGYLYPVFSHIYENVKKPLALIEVGTSAGFQLLWDKYAYSYNSDEVYGDKQSTVHIKSEHKGQNLPPLFNETPPVTDRYGLDLHINDLSNREDALWLSALIWPEHKDRRALFTQAAECVRNNKDEFRFIEGDGVELLPGLAEKIAKASVLCIFHTHVANQMPADVKHKLIENIRRISKKRDVFHIYNNIWDGFLHLDSYINGHENREIIAETDGHGKWFKWKLENN